MRRACLTIVLAFVLAPLAFAHEQKFMGTVASIHEEHLEVKTTTGKSVMIMLDGNTKITRGKASAKPVDIKAGERIVVVTRDGKDKAGKSILVATRVMLATAPPSPKK